MVVANIARLLVTSPDYLGHLVPREESKWDKGNLLLWAANFILGRMPFTSLVVCADAKTVQVLDRILLNMGMEVDHCSDPLTAGTHFLEQHFDTVFVDCQNVGAGAAFIDQLRLSGSHDDVLIIAILNPGVNSKEFFVKGANFALYKPVSDERGGAVAKAASPTRKERRGAPRVAVAANASIAYAATENVVTRVIDLSADGIAIHSAKPVPRNCKIYFEFSLPGENSKVRLSCEVIWQNDSGNVGMRFVDVPTSSRKVLEYWIKNKVGRQLQMVESESTASESSFGDSNVQSTSEIRLQLMARLNLIPASAGDRRRGPRHACSLGAEVSRAGSTVQQRCMVSDVSIGGCYVQTSEPLPVGTSIEIVLRTQEIKVRVFGKVQSVHRGLGMGVHFISEKVPPLLKQLIEEAQKQVVTA